jgi:hypothetical protein
MSGFGVRDSYESHCCCCRHSGGPRHQARGTGGAEGLRHVGAMVGGGVVSDSPESSALATPALVAMEADMVAAERETLTPESFITMAK